MKVEKSGDEVIVYPVGKINISSAENFKEQITSLLKEGNVNICIDFTSVNSVDSSGVGKLLVCRKMINDNGGRFRIRNLVQKGVRDLFYVLDLHKVIDIEDLSE